MLKCVMIANLIALLSISHVEFPSFIIIII